MRLILPTLAALLLLTTAAQAAKPDVRAVRVAASAFAHPGGELSVELTATAKRKKVRRTGVRVYLSADGKRGKGDARVGARKLPPIRRGKRRTLAIGARVPASTAAGARFAIACADDPGRVRERNERNNCRAARVTITAQADPARSTVSLIEADRAAGKLTDERALLYRAYAVLGDARLPARYRGDATAEEDDLALREFANAWPSLSKATRRAFGQRPAKRRARASQDGEFMGEGPCLTDMFITPSKWKSVTAAGGKVRLYWPEDTPAYGRNAAQLAQDVSHAYARFKAIMGRGPLSDATSRCSHGPDGALDIYLTDVPGAAGYTIPSGMKKYNSEWDCKGFPSFIVADAEPGTFSTRFTLAHELFHAFQNAFPYKGACSDYKGFDEGAANWAAHAAFPDDDGEHFFDSLQGTVTGYEVDDAGYHGWPFVLWIDKTFGERTVGSVYGQFRTKPRAAAIDAAIGGFRPYLLDFVKHGWNQGPFPTFKTWDRFDKPAMKRFVPVPETRLFLLNEPTRTAYVKADVRARSRDYQAYRITDDKTRELVFRNTLASNPDFRVGAILTFADGSTRFDDWSGKDRVAYCRDNPAENVVSLVVAYGNSRVDESPISGEPELVMRDRCDGFPWHFKVLNATLETRADGGMKAGGDHECDGFPIQGETVFTAATADDDFSLEHDVKPDTSGALEGVISTYGDSKWGYTVSGCEGSPLQPCSKAFDRFGGPRHLGFKLEAASAKAPTATLSWFVADPEVGFVDYDDSVCNVQNIRPHLTLEQLEQQVPLEWFAGSQPFLLEFKGDGQWSEDQWGRPATMNYDWTYRMTIQRVDEQGNPL